MNTTFARTIKFIAAYMFITTAIIFVICEQFWRLLPIFRTSVSGIDIIPTAMQTFYCLKASGATALTRSHIGLFQLVIVTSTIFSLTCVVLYPASLSDKDKHSAGLIWYTPVGTFDFIKFSWMLLMAIGLCSIPFVCGATRETFLMKIAIIDGGYYYAIMSAFYSYGIYGLSMLIAIYIWRARIIPEQ